MIDKNRQDKNFQRTNTFRKNEPILLVAFKQVKKYLGKFMFAPQKLFWSPVAMPVHMVPKIFFIYRYLISLIEFVSFMQYIP